MKHFAEGMNEGDDGMKAAKRGAWKKAFGEDYDENIGGDKRGMTGPHDEVEQAEDEGLTFVDHEPVPVPIDRASYPELSEDQPGDRARLVLEGVFDEQGVFQADRTAAVHGLKMPAGGGYRDPAKKEGYKSGQPPGALVGGTRAGSPKVAPGFPHEDKGLPGRRPAGGGEARDAVPPPGGGYVGPPGTRFGDPRGRSFDPRLVRR